MTFVLMEGEQGCAMAVRQSWIWGILHPGVRGRACSLIGMRAWGFLGRNDILSITDVAGPAAAAALSPGEQEHHRGGVEAL